MVSPRCGKFSDAIELHNSSKLITVSKSNLMMRLKLLSELAIKVFW